MTIATAAKDYLRGPLCIHALYGLLPGGRCRCGKQCAALGQHPRGKRRTTTRGWNPRDNVGALTGRGAGLLALCACGAEGAESVDLLRAGGLDVGPPPFQNRHWRFWLFAHPSPHLELPTGNVGRSLELRADGGCVPLPPSRVKGGVLVGAVPEQLPPIPIWLLKLVPRDRSNCLQAAFIDILIEEHAAQHPFEDGWTRLLKRVAKREI